ncbi:SPFH domain-containing protein [Crenothrix polyspora]|uniref:Putative virion core protein (Lumpy skin disease virus)-like protein n=1 Tax=Crenothrix polyspora TaxID=360316 RepID=A0A1R4H9F8_9GAMM|nr:SPFH domain-containing protein [Crenothrix polyspora]SJM92661.1 putative virion core protein (Lumpy skin disease virus)-like protein [Crenothrix polyspora]
MGLFGKILGEFVDVIEWTDNASDTMVYRFERYGNAIKYGAMLTVRESQTAILVNEGRIADVYQPGLYKLETNNMPIMTTLESWSHGFNSPFKAEVYFFNMRRFTDLKWGTKNPIMLRDKEFGAVRLRAFGTYTIRIKDPEMFSKEIVGTNGHFVTGEISDQLRNLITARFSSILGESNIPVLDLAGNYDDLSAFISTRIAPEFLEYGLEVSQLLIENISLPEEVEKALDKRTSMGIVGNLNDYTRYQAAEAMQTAAANPSSAASAGVGMGVGFGMANELSRAYSEASRHQATPPPLPNAPQLYVAINGERTGPFNLTTVKQKIQSGEITRSTLVWHDPMPEWITAEKLENLAGSFSNLPPPIPGA